MTKDKDKRRFPRLDIKTPARYRIPTKKMDISMGTIKNLSAGGMCLVTDDHLRKGQIIQVEFGLASENTLIVAKCEMMWVHKIENSESRFKYQYGARFIEIDQEQQEKIVRFVVNRLKTLVKEELDKTRGADHERRYSVLFIDDDAVTLKTVEEVFSDEFNVLTASDGHEGVHKAREWRPDVILLDIIMPEIDGFSTLMMLKDFEETKDIPVMMLSVVSDRSKIFQAIRDGATDFILKPFIAENLISKIRKVIETK
jgi:CheY-like chemotaxis protein